MKQVLVGTAFLMSMSDYFLKADDGTLIHVFDEGRFYQVK